MPEIGEVARIVSFIQKHLVNKTLAVVKAQHDENVYGKVGCSAAEFEKALHGKKVLDARQQGKYFWLVMSSPPHPLMHFGMAGWFKIRGEETAYYKPTKPADPEEWPPKYWKFHVQTEEKPVCEAAYVDFRRFGRIRLIDCDAENIRNVSPLKENGPDPVVDREIVTEEWLKKLLMSKKIPVKALLLDQANISGIGNWVGDELLYDAKIHPEQYSNTFSDAQVKQLHTSIHYVCSVAVTTKSDSSLFPETWLFKHRWGKGKKDSTNTLPNGAKIVFLTVGGRTSAVVPSVQKKTGKVAKDVDPEDLEPAKSSEKAKKGSRKRKETKEESDSEDDEVVTITPKKASKKRKSVKDETEVDAEEEVSNPISTTNGKSARTKATKTDPEAGFTVTSKKAAATAAEPAGNGVTRKSANKKQSATAAPKGGEKEAKPMKQKTAPVKPYVDIGRRRSARVNARG
ncbi:hypothetical protein MMC25_005175 [Agyrium rufum]|nr:hypothetical protein [Agyrium rufum]